eukprot:3480422-Amphidinium_carterae.1
MGRAFAVLGTSASFYDMQALTAALQNDSLSKAMSFHLAGLETVKPERGGCCRPAITEVEAAQCTMT